MRAELTDELPHLRRYAMSLARQKDEADDLVQECLVKALAAADKFEPGTNLRAWLFTILRNAFINKTRDRARANALTDGMAKLYGMSSPPAQHSTLELRETTAAIDRLPPSQRQALILVVHEGCSYQTAAKIMGTPTGTVRSRLSRAREALRAEPPCAAAVQLRGARIVPYARNRELPDNVLGVLPAHAEDIYRNAFNSAWEEYKDPDDRRGDASREETAHKVAWAAVKKVYEKGDDGRWHRRSD